MIRAAQAGVSPERVADMTLHEVRVELGGYERRKYEQLRLVAIHLAPIMRFMGSSGTTPATILGERPVRRNIVGDAAAAANLLAAAKKGGRRG